MRTPPPFGFETLYKTDSPKDFATGEYFQLRLEVKSDPATLKIHYFVRELHGYFDNEHKRNVHPVVTYSPEEGYETMAEAQGRYEQQVAQRASEGFKHSFSLDPFEGMKYRKIA
jgi:hypothetical protein